MFEDDPVIYRMPLTRQWRISRCSFAYCSRAPSHGVPLPWFFLTLNPHPTGALISRLHGRKEPKELPALWFYIVTV